MKPWLKNRVQKSSYSNIFEELRLRDQEEFLKYLRMNTNTYTVIFNIFYHMILRMTFIIRAQIEKLLKPNKLITTPNGFGRLRLPFYLC